MSRSYSEALSLQLNQADPNYTGVALGLVCLEAKLPATYVAQALGVSRMTIHSWFRGSPLRDKNRKAVEAFIKEIEQGIKDGDLPATSVKAAKRYIENITGERL